MKCTISFVIIHTKYFTAEFEENILIDDSKFAPLEPPDSPKNFSVPPLQVNELTNIQAISKAIRSFQV